MDPAARPVDTAADSRTELERVVRAATRSLRRWRATGALGHLDDIESYLERMLDLAPAVAPPSRLDLDLVAERSMARAFGEARRAMRRWHVSGDPQHLSVAGEQLELLLDAAPIATVASSLPELTRDLAAQLRALAPRLPGELN